jgi:hypothetical protein
VAEEKLARELTLLELDILVCDGLRIERGTGGRLASSWGVAAMEVVDVDDAETGVETGVVEVHDENREPGGGCWVINASTAGM